MTDGVFEQKSKGKDKGKTKEEAEEIDDDDDDEDSRFKKKEVRVTPVLPCVPILHLTVFRIWIMQSKPELGYQFDFESAPSKSAATSSSGKKKAEVQTKKKSTGML